MKFAYFNPTVMAIEDIPYNLFQDFKEMVITAHNHSGHNDAGNPAISVRGGQQIQVVPNEFKLNTDSLKAYIELSCQEYIGNIMKQNGRSDLDPYKPELISAWTIKQSSGDYQALHSHEAHISGNIYIETPELDEFSRESDANIEFRLPVIRNPAHLIFTDHWKFSPEPMKMIIFPSYVPHTVYPWQGEGNRTILAWDVRLVGK